jgi:integrase
VQLSGNYKQIATGAACLPLCRERHSHKSRLLPIHASTRQALNDYIAIRTRLGCDGDDLFVVTTGRAPHKITTHVIFVKLARQLGLRGPVRTRGPRLHDLRHNSGNRIIPATDEKQVYFPGDHAIIGACLAE